LFIYGFGVSLDLDHLRVGVVMQDTNPDANTFLLSMRNSRYFDVSIDKEEDPFITKLTAGKIRGIVYVPFWFSQYEMRDPDQKGPIYVIADGSEPNTANFVQNYVRGAWLNYLKQQSVSEAIKDLPRISMQSRYWYNEELNSRFFLIPGSIAIIMTLIGTLLTALVVAREWERGTMEALMATPVTMGEFLISKMICYLAMGMASMIMCSLLSILLFGVPYRGSFLLLIFVSFIFLMAALGIGLLISTTTRNQFVASQISIMSAFLPAFMLSGFLFEISSMPPWIQFITHLIPAKYMVSSLQTLFLVGNVWEMLALNVLVMALMACILFVILALKTKKRLD
jgi:ABC-2 type transport system permease protein